MDPNESQSFTHLLTGDETQSERGNSSNAPRHPPSWHHYPPPHNPPLYSQQFPPQYPTRREDYYPPQNNPQQSYNYGSMPVPCYPPHPPRTTSVAPQPSRTSSPTPHPSPSENPKNKEGGLQPPKWTLEEDRRLVKSWINVSTNPIIGADQKLAGFWTKVASTFNQHAPDGAVKRTGKVCNARWNRAAPLVSKWCACVGQAYRAHPSGTNEDDIMQNAQDLYVGMVGKKFDLMHWWLLLKDQPKWETFCDQSAEASSKRLRVTEVGPDCEGDAPGTPNTPTSLNTPASESTPAEVVGGIIRPIGTKAAKRKAKELGADPVLDIVTTGMSAIRATNEKNSSMFEEYVQAQKKKAEAAAKAVQLRDRQLSLEERKQRLKEMKYEDKILKMNIAEMCPEDQAHYGAIQEEIRGRYRQKLSSSDIDLNLD